MKILLLGANGQVGFELARSLAPLGELYLASRDGHASDGSQHRYVIADLANPESLGNLLHQIAPDVIVNAAAYTAVDRAEGEEDLAERINHHALTVLGNWAERNKALVIHYSTDYVFDGNGTRPYREEDATAPLGVYGRSKLAGENALRESGCKHLIFRTAWVYAARGHNFVRTMLRLAKDQAQVRVVNDQRGAPTSARLIADATALALSRWFEFDEKRQREVFGTYHLTSSGDVSWNEFAQAIFSLARPVGLIDREIEVVPISTADYPTKAKRPAYSVLDTQKFRSTFGLNLPPWKDGLVAVIAELVAAQPK